MHTKAPPDGLHALELPGVNRGSRPQESVSDSKAVYAKKNFVTNERKNGWTDRRDGRNSGVLDLSLKLSKIQIFCLSVLIRMKICYKRTSVQCPHFSKIVYLALSKEKKLYFTKG